MTYQPKTKQTQEIYELMLVFLQEYVDTILSYYLFIYRFLGDIQHDVLASATDEALIILKDESMKDFDKQKEIESIISARIPSEVF